MLKKRTERLERQIKVTFFHVVLEMRGCSIITSITHEGLTWPSSHLLFTNVSHMGYVFPDSSKKIKYVLAEFNEGGSLKQYGPHEVRTFSFQAFKNPKF